MYNCDHYDNEPYYEPTIADEILIEFQQKMKDALLENVKLDIKNIKIENEKLKQENTYLKSEINKIEQKERDLETKKLNLERQVKNERLAKLMADFQVIMYRPDRISVKLPKCDKCDGNRKIKFISPLSKIMYESCTCDVSKSVYNVEEYICTEFRLNRDNNKMLMWYKMKQSDDYDYASYRSGSSDLAESIYKDGMKFENLDKGYTYFKSKDDCQKYCDYLNRDINEDEVELLD